MNGVIGEPGERAFAAVKEDFDFISSRVLLDALEDFGGFFLS
jgi:hypothetical protein